jgi:hypothetical protein
MNDQRSLTDQLKEMARYAASAGLYDASDRISMVLKECKEREAMGKRLARLEEVGNDERTVTRLEDMSPDGSMSLHRQEDGDFIVTVRESGEKGFGSSVEFCMSGTRSPRTVTALGELMKAMREDREAGGKHGPA